MRNISIPFTRGLIIFISCILSTTGSTQELKKEKKYLKNNRVERYYTLKKNKSVKQGQYVKYVNSVIGPDMLLEYGQYENNLKVGTWYSFKNDGYNSLESAGEYIGGKKENYWIYFYNHVERHVNISIFAGAYRKSEIIEPEKSKDPLIINFDTTGLKISHYGKYIDGVKNGVWVYLNRNGNVIHQFDYTNNKLVSNKELFEKELPVTYLGGIERFNDIFKSEVINHVKLSQSFISPEIRYIVKKGENSVSYERIDEVNNEDYDFLDELLSSLPDEWISIDNQNSYKNTVVIVYFGVKEDSDILMNVAYEGSD